MKEYSPHLQVLVVEDELLIRWSIAETLVQCGHSVVEAADGATAVEALTHAAKPVDVVLLDYRLPDSNDFSLLQSIRRLTPGSPVILMTAYGSPEITQNALQLGACRVMNKPFDMKDVADAVTDAYVHRPL